MSNIINNNFYNLKLNINHDEYWDFFLNNDHFDSYYFTDEKYYDKCLISLIDVSLYDCVFENEINGLPTYTWEYAVSNGATLNNIGYTGFDNGLLYFRKDKIMNSDFVKLYQDSEYKIPNEKYLVLHQVTGSTMVYEYPLTVEDFQIKLNGGFYQGFFKTECDEYQVLPSYLEQGNTWGYEFVLKKTEFEKESDKTLNDKYPSNKGIFFYIGTRAENKWIYLYDEDNGECFTLSPDDYVEDAHLDVKTHKIDAFLDMSIIFEPDTIDNYISDKYYLNDLYNHTNFDSNYVDFGKKNDIELDESFEYILDCRNDNKYNIQCSIFNDDYLGFKEEEIDGQEYDFIEDDLDISDFEYLTDGDLTIGKFEEYFDTDNKFLIFSRACGDITVDKWKEGTTVRYINEKYDFTDNLFLLANRTCNGLKISGIKKLKTSKKTEYNIYNDLYSNALAFRITDDGAIGYRYLVYGCENDVPYKILEGYSKDGIVKNDEWSVIHVKMVGFHDTMKLMFYVNGKLVFVTDEMPKMNLRKLAENDEKQESVPFNISIGGGTQGLCDVILPNYMIEPYRVYPLEKHFGGSFIGYFKSFKMYDCDVEYMDIYNNFEYEINNSNLN